MAEQPSNSVDEAARCPAAFSAIGTRSVDERPPSSSKRQRQHEVVPCVHQQCAIHEPFDVNGTTLSKDRFVRTKSLPTIPQLDHPVTAGPLEVQRKLDPADCGAWFKAPQDVRHERDTAAADINLRPPGHRREFQPMMC